MTDIVKKEAPKILAAIKSANNILLHCHPSPDPDSVGSALAMKFALEQMGKKATVIRGDSEIPQAFMHFPGADSIVPKNFFEVDLKEFDLFIIQDTGDISRVSRIAEVKIPKSMPTIAIDHHDSTQPFGTTVNLIEPSYPSTAAILFDLFKLWKITLTPEIAANLFIGTYTDTGGFKYEKTKPEIFLMAEELTSIYPQFSSLILTMENGSTPDEIKLLGLAFSNIKTFFDGRFALATISLADLESHGLSSATANTSRATSMMRSVKEWLIACTCIEMDSGRTKASFRSADSEKFDVSKLAVALGGGGHKAAAGAVLSMPLDKAIEKIVQTAKEIYNL